MIILISIFQYLKTCKSNKLQEHLYNYFKVKSENFILIHSESSYEKYDLEISSSYDKIYINKESDIFGNMFLYEELIKKAKKYTA